MRAFGAFTAKSQLELSPCFDTHTTTNPDDMHLGHKNVPTSKGGLGRRQCGS